MQETRYVQIRIPTNMGQAFGRLALEWGVRRQTLIEGILAQGLVQLCPESVNWKGIASGAVFPNIPQVAITKDVTDYERAVIPKPPPPSPRPLNLSAKNQVALDELRRFGGLTEEERNIREYGPDVKTWPKSVEPPDEKWGEDL